MNTNFINKNNQRGQILVIVLIVIMILGITIVSITNNNIRDTDQSLANTKYESMHADAEDVLLDISQDPNIGKTNTINVNQVQTNFSKFTDGVSGCSVTNDTSRTNYLCTGIKQNSDGTKYKKSLKVTNSYFLESVELFKDDQVNFMIDPTVVPKFDRTNVFTVSLEGESVTDATVKAGVEVSLDYTYTDNQGIRQYSTVRGFFDRTGTLFPSLKNDYFTFTPIGNGSVINSFSFNIGNIINKIVDPSNDTYYLLGDKNATSIEPIGLRFKLIYATSEKTSIPSFYITVKDSVPQPITQSRIIETTIVQQDTSGNIYGPQSFISTSIPMYKTPTIFDYAVRTRNDFVHN